MCFEGLAELLAFQGKEPTARAIFRKGSQAHKPSTRYWRQWATFEKRAGELEVRSAALRCAGAAALGGAELRWVGLAALHAGCACCPPLMCARPLADPPGPRCSARRSCFRGQPRLSPVTIARGCSGACWSGAAAAPRPPPSALHAASRPRRATRTCGRCLRALGVPPAWGENASGCTRHPAALTPHPPPPTTLAHTPHRPPQVYGVLLFGEGRAAEAREVLRQGVAHNPANPQLCMEWALAEEAAGNLGALRGACGCGGAAEGHGWAGLGECTPPATAAPACAESAVSCPRLALAAEDALKIFEQGAASQEPHTPLLAAWASLAQRMGRRELASRVERQLDAATGAQR